MVINDDENVPGKVTTVRGWNLLQARSFRKVFPRRKKVLQKKETQENQKALDQQLFLVKTDITHCELRAALLLKFICRQPHLKIEKCNSNGFFACPVLTLLIFNMNSAVFSIHLTVSHRNKHSILKKDMDFSVNWNEWKSILEQTGSTKYF